MGTTKEIFVVSLSDIEAFRLQCGDCGGAVVMPLSADSDTPPEFCPLCRNQWPRREGPQGFPEPAWRLMIAIRDLRNANKSPMTVRHEINSKETTI